MTQTILVTGGTGNIGGAFVQRLAADARRPVVRVATRDPASPAARLLQAMSPETVVPVRFDVKDAGSVRAAFDGVTELFVIAPFVADLAAWHEPIAAAAKACGTCRHVVKVSVTGARAADATPPPGRIPSMHYRGEEILRATGIPSTMIRPTIFMQHFVTTPALYGAGADRFCLPTGDAKIAWLDCRDIGAFAAAVVMLPDGARAEWTSAYELSGPAAITAREIAAALSAASERTVEHVDGEAAFVARAKEIGAPDVLVNVYREAAGGWFAKVERDAFAKLTGRLPTSFASFALDHQAFFAKRDHAG